MVYARSPAILLLGVLVLVSCDVSINSSIVVPDGESRSGSMATVNGDISIVANSRPSFAPRCRE